MSNRGADVAPRMLPPLDDTNRAFWTGGADGRLLIQRCERCGRWQHPPSASCADCGGPVTAERVTGDGTVFTFTVNHHPFHPAVPVPYVIAIVELDEQDDLRLLTDLVEVDPAVVSIGMRVHVAFEQHDERWVPVFRPAP
jgi:uncharacterized OB-fold protein